jgi:MEMO1 family protein
LELAKTIRWAYTSSLGPGRLPPADEKSPGSVAVVAPHAGYEYSGPVAAHSYLHVSSLRDPELLVVVAPDHYGLGPGVATFEEGEWETPLGALRVDPDATRRFVEASGSAVFDPASTRMEHSLEVQLPFLQAVYGDKVPLLPVSLTFQDETTAEDVARGVLKAIEGKRAVVAASSDLTHYEPEAEAARKDAALLREVENMDVKGFYSVLEALKVTACGFGAIAAVMKVAEGMGLRRGEVLKYATSADATGDKLQVVGYAALRFVQA